MILGGVVAHLRPIQLVLDAADVDQVLLVLLAGQVALVDLWHAPELHAGGLAPGDAAAEEGTLRAHHVPC